MEHTKGEWIVKENGKYETPSIWGSFPDGSGTQEICRVKDTYAMGTTGANAHLIAAAPDMYEALKGIVADLENVVHPDVLEATLAALLKANPIKL